MKRRERTRHLIELGGLVQKAGLVELTRDDRAALYGAFMFLATMLKADDAEHALALWGRGGKRAFEAEGSSIARGEHPSRVPEMTRIDRNR